MTETGKIISLKGAQAEVVCDEAAGCKSCSGSAFCNVKTRRFEALLSRKLQDAPNPPQPGDRVEVYIPPGKTIAAGFMVLMVPLILFISGFVLGSRILPGRSEGLHALFGLAGLAGGFLIALGYNRITGKNHLPVIVSILVSEEVDQEEMGPTAPASAES